MRPRLKSISPNDAGDYQDAVYNASSGLWEAAGWVEYAESIGISSTTSDTFQSKLSLTTSASMPAGTYRMSWHSVWVTGTTYSIQVRVRIGATVLILYQTRGSGSTANNQPSWFGSKLVALSAGAETFDVFYRRVGTTATVSTSNTAILLQRVGV